MERFFIVNSDNGQAEILPPYLAAGSSELAVGTGQTVRCHGSLMRFVTRTLM
ncbi:MAG: hypothetical protein M3O30_05240 [Planctomycetota bacterium]|nr:hypothetical protein [Planctomycetota bacterium]